LRGGVRQDNYATPAGLEGYTPQGMGTPIPAGNRSIKGCAGRKIKHSHAEHTSIL